MTNFSAAERKIANLFKKGNTIIFKDEEYTIVDIGKPTCKSGEPKTDIYILLENSKNTQEIKISYKKKNAEFLENKTSATRAERILGPDWRETIKNTTLSIKDKFENRDRIFKRQHGRTQKGSITLGWKFELMLVPGGELSGEMDFSHEQIFDIYSGINLPAEKKNASINGKVIKDSGIANYILHSDNVVSAQDAINQMVTIDEFIKKYPKIYFACKALNYRTFENKYDGNRPLAVQVNWKVIDKKLSSDIIFDFPLELNGTEMAEQLLSCMNSLCISSTDEINKKNSDMNLVLED